MAMLSIRIDLGDGARLGPGKVRLLELIEELGSISAAARAMRMSYRRAWRLVEELNGCFETVVVSQTGGRQGGGASLTPAGRALIAAYRGLADRAEEAARAELAAIQGARRRD